MNTHPEANFPQLTIAQKLDELIAEVKRLGGLFDAIAMNDDGTWRARLTPEEDQQLIRINALISKVTRQIRIVTEGAAKQ
ncbi:hypothetical protein [Corynebacterium glutamicum]|uniref:Uncharacterized protein n=2 Tax=Corynebacterium glutamicum TaxID=1718 RepID=Q5KRG5_CORGT|nr:hypothetical protein [Corynebacterium glutamicum]BAD84122.1 hypothetical protein [Corynebacterium glutamicum]BAF54914.1 hypothetical protein cgR_1919 [Corynebacterium glutamicum R]